MLKLKSETHTHTYIYNTNTLTHTHTNTHTHTHTQYSARTHGFVLQVATELLKTLCTAATTHNVGQLCNEHTMQDRSVEITHDTGQICRDHTRYRTDL